MTIGQIHREWCPEGPQCSGASASCSFYKDLLKLVQVESERCAEVVGEWLAPNVKHLLKVDQLAEDMLLKIQKRIRES